MKLLLQIFIAIFICVFAYIVMAAFETPIKYIDVEGKTCACLIAGEKIPSQSQCKLVGDKFETIKVQKCDN